MPKSTEKITITKEMLLVNQGAHVTLDSKTGEYTFSHYDTIIAAPSLEAAIDELVARFQAQYDEYEESTRPTVQARLDTNLAKKSELEAQLKDEKDAEQVNTINQSLEAIQKLIDKDAEFVARENPVVVTLNLVANPPAYDASNADSWQPLPQDPSEVTELTENVDEIVNPENVE